MVEFFGLDVSMRVFFNIMTSFAFVISIMLLVSPEAFEVFNKVLQKEYGLKKKFFPHIEDTKIDAIDKAILRNRTITGLILAVVSFAILLISK